MGRAEGNTGTFTPEARRTRLFTGYWSKHMGQVVRQTHMRLNGGLKGLWAYAGSGQIATAITLGGIMRKGKAVDSEQEGHINTLLGLQQGDVSEKQAAALTAAIGALSYVRAEIAKDQKHSHYYRDVRHLEQIDVYRVLTLFGVTDPCLQHIIKKALCAGQRGVKDFEKDVQEIADTATRRLQMLAEDAQ